MVQADSSKTLITDLQSVSSVSHHRSSSKKFHHTQPRTHKSPAISKGNKSKPIANTVQLKSKRSDAGKKKHPTKITPEIIFTSTGLSSKPLDQTSTLPIPSNKTAKKSVTNAVISYLHHRDMNGGKHVTGRQTKCACLFIDCMNQNSSKGL